MGPAARSLAADAHGCIMVGFTPIDRIQACGAMIRRSMVSSPHTVVHRAVASLPHQENDTRVRVLRAFARKRRAALALRRWISFGPHLGRDGCRFSHRLGTNQSMLRQIKAHRRDRSSGGLVDQDRLRGADLASGSNLTLAAPISFRYECNSRTLKAGKFSLKNDVNRNKIIGSFALKSPSEETHCNRFHLE
jgi:hypothetical protein